MNKYQLLASSIYRMTSGKEQLREGLYIGKKVVELPKNDIMFIDLSDAYDSLRKVVTLHEFEKWAYKLHSSMPSTINEEEFRWSLLNQEESKYDKDTILRAKGLALSLCKSSIQNGLAEHLISMLE